MASMNNEGSPLVFIDSFLDHLVTIKKNRAKYLSEKIEGIQDKLLEINSSSYIEDPHKPTSQLEKMQLRVKKSVIEKESRRLKIRQRADQDLINRLSSKYELAKKKLRFLI